MNEEGLPELREIISFFQRTWDLRIVWCRREENAVADCLAKLVLEVGAGLVSFEHVPMEAADMVMKDLTSVLV